MKNKKSPWATNLSPHRIQAIDSHIPKSRCCECNAKMTMAIGFGITPRPGDPVLCSACAGVNIFDETLRMRRPTEEELIDILSDPDIRRYRSELLKFSEKHKHENN
jgi:hypothetical protein